MRTLFFDTETTGKVNWHLPPEHQSQPRVVSLAAIIGDESGKTHSFLRAIIKPDGWEIPSEAADIHGITTDIALRDGVPIEAVLPVFFGLLRTVDRAVAYNSDFDVTILDGESIRLTGWPMFVDVDVVCAMKMATPVVNLPPNPGYSTPAWPKLSVAYHSLIGKPLENAHGAWADAVATMKVYNAILQRNQPTTKETAC